MAEVATLHTHSVQYELKTLSQQIEPIQIDFLGLMVLVRALGSACRGGILEGLPSRSGRVEPISHAVPRNTCAASITPTPLFRSP